MKYFFLFSLMIFSFSANGDITHLSKSSKDIKSLFYFLIKHHDFGHVIFGTKPMSLADVDLKTADEIPLLKRFKTPFVSNKIKRCIDTWYKNEEDIKFKNFIFLGKEEDLFDCLVLVLINKSSMINILQRYEIIFKEELGDSFTPETFLKNLENKTISLAQAIHQNDRLLGIMLGYGDRNASLFQERQNLLKEISKRKKEKLEPNFELNRKLELLDAQFSDFSTPEENSLINPLNFFADMSHPETMEIKQNYEHELKQIEDLMKQPGFMDLVLDRLVGTQ